MSIKTALGYGLFLLLEVIGIFYLITENLE